jgi:branched-chain amino acid transport system substrate-binding protein
VPQGVEACEREKRDGAVSMMVYGTPQVQALNQKLTEDKIPGTSPGFGIAASADGKRYPYLFPVAATYWSQGAAAVQFVKEKLGGNLRGKKIAYIFYDNPAGREPLPVIEDLQQVEKFELRTFAVPPPGVEMGAQVLDITQRYRPDFVIAHLFGRSPSLAIKEFKRTGFPLSKVMGLVWASAEHDILAAGGWPVAEAYHTLTFAGIGDDYPVRQEIKAMYKAQGRELPSAMDDTVSSSR